MIYLIGSLRNPRIADIANEIESSIGQEVYADWAAAGPLADDSWRDYERTRGRGYREALASHAARHVFSFDRFHLTRAHGAVLLLPAGRSGHLEAGVVSGEGKPVFVLLEGGEEPARYDVMTRFLHSVCRSPEELQRSMRAYPWPKLPALPRIALADAQWLAGLLEGEGSFCLTHSRTGTRNAVPRMVLQMTDEDIVERAASILGSAVWRNNKNRRLPNRKRVYACGVAGLTAIEWMRILRPYLGHRRQAQIIATVDGWLQQRGYNRRDEPIWRRWFGIDYRAEGIEMPYIAKKGEAPKTATAAYCYSCGKMRIGDHSQCRGAA